MRVRPWSRPGEPHSGACGELVRPVRREGLVTGPRCQSSAWQRCHDAPAAAGRVQEASFLPSGGRNVGKASAGQKGGPLAEPLAATAHLLPACQHLGLSRSVLGPRGRRADSGGGRGHFEAGAGLAPGGWLIQMGI